MNYGYRGHSRQSSGAKGNLRASRDGVSSSTSSGGWTQTRGSGNGSGNPQGRGNGSKFNASAPENLNKHSQSPTTRDNNLANNASSRGAKTKIDATLNAAIGSTVLVSLTSGRKVQGILSKVTTVGNPELLLKKAKVLNSSPPTVLQNLKISSQELVNLIVDFTYGPKGSGSRQGFRTDTDISASSGMKTERPLTRWQDDNPSAQDLGSLNDMKNDKPWDQFAVNRDKFGVQATYDEHMYTTRINRSHPDYEERERRAEKLAQEIMSQAPTDNVHLAEERGLVVDDSGMDEEDKYSGVARKSEKSLVPPHASKTSRQAQAPVVSPDVSRASFDSYVAREAREVHSKYYEEREKKNRLSNWANFAKEFSNAAKPATDSNLDLDNHQALSSHRKPLSTSTANSSPQLASKSPSKPSTSPKPRRKFNFDAAAKSSGSFRPSNPSATFGAAANVDSSVMQIPVPVPMFPMPNFHPVSNVYNSTSPEAQVARKSTKGKFDYILTADVKNESIPPPFVTPPAWTATANVSYKDQLPALPMPMQVMPWGYMPAPYLV